MNTLHVHSGNLFGGVERILETLAGVSVRAEIETSVALCFQGRLGTRLGELGTRIHDLGSVRASRPWQVSRAQRRLRGVLDTTAPDVVIAHSDWSHGLFGPIVRSTGLPFIRWLHAPEAGPAWQARLAERVPPDLVLCNSHYTSSAASTRFRGVRREVVYAPMVLGTPPDRAATRAELGVDRHTAVILIAARLEPWKGHQALLTALAGMPARPDWEAWVAGGPQRPEERRYLDALERQAATAGLSDRVRFLGERTDLPRLMAAADVYCQPNESPEPFGMSIVEALAAGLPVVVTALGAFPEIVTPGCGLLVAPDRTQDLTSALSGLVEDADRRAELAVAARARAREMVDPGRQLAHLRDALHTATESVRLAEA